MNVGASPMLENLDKLFQSVIPGQSVIGTQRNLAGNSTEEKTRDSSHVHCK
jgi:hypothetical protein